MSSPTRARAERDQRHEHDQREERSDEREAPFRFASQAERRRMLIIVNPYATTVSDRLRHLVVYALQGRFEVDAVDTEARGHATEICREAAHEGYDVVVAFGGDGTINEAANGLVGSPTPLCCLPGGSANVFAKMLGIPGDVVDATEHLLGMADAWRALSPRARVAGHRQISGLGALSELTVRSVDERPLPLQVDGDYLGEVLEARYSIMPRALNIVS